MRLLFLLSSLHGGGAERVAATLANAWAQRGVEVHLVCCYSGRGHCEQVLDPRVQVGWLADRLPAHPLWRALWKLPRLRALIGEVQPDRVLSFLTNVNVTALLASRGLGMPVVVSERTDPLHARSAGWLLRALRRWTYPWARRVVVQTPASRDHLRVVAPRVRDIAVIPNPLPPDLPPLRRAEPQGARKTLVAVGRFNPVKQFDRLIHVFATLAVQHPDWDLVIWGEGPERAACQAQAQALGLADRIRLPGYHRQVWEAMSQSHVFMLCSRVEGFPNALLEAMALGLPCVATDCPSGPADITRQGRDADLVPVADEDAWRAALDRWMRGEPHIREKRGQEAAQSVRSRYGLEAVLEAWNRTGLDWLSALPQSTEPSR